MFEYFTSQGATVVIYGQAFAVIVVLFVNFMLTMFIWQDLKASKLKDSEDALKLTPQEERRTALNITGL